MIQDEMLPEAIVPKVDENRRYTTRASCTSSSGSLWSMRGISTPTRTPRVTTPRAGSVPRAISRVSSRGSSGRAAPAPTPSRSHGGRPCGLAFRPKMRATSIAPAAHHPVAHLRQPALRCHRAAAGENWQTIAQSNVCAHRSAGRDGDAGQPHRTGILAGPRRAVPCWSRRAEPRGLLARRAQPRTRQFYGHPGNPEPKSGQAEWPSVVLVWRRA